FAHIRLVDLEVRDLQAPHRVDRKTQRLLDQPRIVGLPKPSTRVAQRTENLGAVEPLPLAVIAEAHCVVAVLLTHLVTFAAWSPCAPAPHENSLESVASDCTIAAVQPKRDATTRDRLCVVAHLRPHVESVRQVSGDDCHSW